MANSKRKLTFKSSEVIVYLDGDKIGVIREQDDGYAYFLNEWSDDEPFTEVHPSINALKKYLEERNDRIKHR
tara:strand:+ start:25 stop:240 length:216 start_codon:yes stop_codon:yes gene_type:complete